MKTLFAILLAGTILLSIMAALACAIHEGGHYLAARFFGKRLKFRFAWGRFGVPRFVWNMPVFYQCEMWKAKVIAAAGFGAELFAAVVLLAAWPEFGLWYTGVAVAHLAAYRWYAGEASDFKWFGRG